MDHVIKTQVSPHSHTANVYSQLQCELHTLTVSVAGTSPVVWAQLKAYFSQTGEYPSLHVPNSVSSSSFKSYILLMTSPRQAPATLGWSM